MTDLPAHVQAELRAQRREWWAGVGQITLGVFLGLLLFALVAWIAAEAYVDLA